MIRLNEALDILRQTLDGVTLPSETVSVVDALGRTLAADQQSRLDLPPFDKSAMDGYAVLANDQRANYRVLQTVAAGSVPTVELVPGAAVKVMTGAPVPRGAGRVIKIEDVHPQGDMIEVVASSGASHICRQGEDVRRGDIILPAGSCLSPLDLANLIGAGIAQVAVFRPIRLAILSTGDEIADSPEQLREGMIMNTNGPLLRSLARRAHMEVVECRSLGDDRAAIAAAIHETLDRADIVILSGGVSVGDFDYVTSALEDAGLRVYFTALAIKPGRPTTYASAHGKAVFALPGNPVSVYLMFHLLVRFAVAQLHGATGSLREIEMPLESEYRRRAVDRTEYVPCFVQTNGTLARVEYHGSAHLTALSQADGFFVVPEGVAAIAAGQRVAFVSTTLNAG